MILALTVPNAASAELLFPTDTKKFVIDEAGVLTQTEVETLTEDLLLIYNEWETEIVVVIIESTAHYQVPDQLSDNSTNGTSDNSSNGTSDNSSNGTSDNSSNETIDEPMMGLQDFSEALFDEWQVGDQEWKDGILLVLSINQSEDDYKWWFNTGIFWDDYWVFDH
ncbi:MAG: TPM domain-containing protein, partial [Euryarchaeota archaeon]|nr:TPM domain-containing protein [Euryarchaeota archaeon]